MSRPSPIRVLALLDANEITGPAKNLLLVARGLAQRGAAEIAIATILRGERRNRFLESCAQSGIETHTILERRRFDPAVIPQLRDVVLRRQPHIIQTHQSKSHFLVRLGRYHKQVPWVAFNHGYTAENLKVKLYNQLDRWSLRRAHRVVAVCEAFADALRRAGIDGGRISVLHNSVSPMEPATPEAVLELRQELGIPAGAKVVLTSGRMSPEKAQGDALRALALLRQGGKAPEFRFVMVGDGQERQRLEELCRALGMSGTSIFAGSTTDMPLYYALADIFIMPSRSEGSPNVILEAMIAGKPVVATAVGGVPEIIQTGTTGLLVPAGDVEAMAQGVAALLADESLRNQYGERARAWVSLHHSREGYLRSVLKVYEQVLEAAPAVGGA